MRQTTGGANDLLTQYSGYTSQHLPTTMTDAAGQTTSFTYTGAGDVATIVNARQETTTYSYSTDGYLQSVAGPASGATTAYTYDGYGRLRTTTSDGYAVTLSYDAMDRPTRTTFPDGTYEEATYERLDVVARRDRAGRTTRVFFDAARQPIATRDPLGRLVQHDERRLIDANGNRTTWDRDVQGRVTRETRADGVTDTVYAYDPATGLLRTVTDPKGQVTTYSYNRDDAVQSIVFSNAQVATPSVSFTYGTTYGRVATMEDGTGTTTYGYHPVGSLGAGQMASVDGPLGNDTITHAYDELGRVVERAIDGVALSLSYDSLGRVTEEVNVLGTFSYTYQGDSGRLGTVTYPNGQTSTYGYLPASQDHRLQTIHHRYPGGSTLSKFDYTYDATGNILTWDQQADSDPALRWRYRYDSADQLVEAIKESTDPAPVPLNRYTYRYDAAGNRLTEQIDAGVKSWTYDSRNRLIGEQSNGVIRVAGTINEPGTVTIDGQPAQVSATNAFEGTATLATGTNTFTVTATDASGNVATQAYQIDSTGSSRTFTFDANGNLTSDGTRTFEWDARNQLVAVNVGTHRSEFAYDGQQRRVRVVEKENGVAESDTRVLWCGTAICEERAADGVTVTRRAFGHGEQSSGSSRYFATDHLGSVTELTNGSAALLARYSFDPSGRRAITAGIDSTTAGFTGHSAHAPSATHLTLYRAYDPDLARWLSEDPMGLDAGPNFYTYVENSPTTAVDPLGLASRKFPPFRTRPCKAQESVTCAATCRAQGKEMESCGVSQTFRIVRVTDQDGAVKTLRKWMDGPMSCSCTDPKERVCGETCVKVLVVVGVLGSIAWVCLTRTPPPVPVFP